MSLSDWIDGIVSAVSPARGLQRRYARQLAREWDQLAAHEGAEISRTTSDWPRRTYGPHEETLTELPTMTARARAAFRNDGVARSITGGYVRNTAGTGIWPRAQARNPQSGELLTDFNQRADKLFRRWAQNPRRCDRQGLRSFPGVLRQLEQESVISGQGFLVLNFQSRSGTAGDRGVPNLQLEMFETEQLATEFDTPGRANRLRFTSDQADAIRGGIELDSAGRPIAYLVHLRNHPEEGHVRREPARIPANRVLHYGEQERVGGVLQPTKLGPVLKDLFNRQGYKANETLAKKIESFFGMVIQKNSRFPDPQNLGIPPAAGTTPHGSASGGGDSQTEAGMRQLDFQPGLVPELYENEELKPVESARPGSNFGEFMQRTSDEAAAGAELSGSLVQRRVTSSYAAGRQEMLEDYKVFDVRQQTMIDQVVRPIWQLFIMLALAEGRLDPPRSMQGPNGRGDVFSDIERLEDLLEASYQTPARPWVDPAKEMAATKIAIDYGINNHADILNKLGKDWRANASSIAEVMQLYEQLGIPMPWAPGSGGDAPATSPSEPKPRGSGDRPGDGNAANASAAGAGTTAEQIIQWAIAEQPETAQKALAEQGLAVSAA